jgi:hypothetical protein
MIAGAEISKAGKELMPDFTNLDLATSHERKVLH